MSTPEGPARRALDGIRICDFTGQLAGAGATRTLAALGAQVIRIEDPVRKGRWDILRGMEPFVDDRRGLEFGGAFNNHNVEKLGVTINLRIEEGRALFEQLVAISDVVTENFSYGVLARYGYTYETLCAVKSDVIYVSNSGFGHDGPYRTFRSWGPIVQGVSGLTLTSGLDGQPCAGWGYSYMDHHGANYMAVGILAALVHHRRTGEGQWVDMSCTEAGTTLLGPMGLDVTVNARRFRDERWSSNRSEDDGMVPHGIFACAGSDQWVAIACRDDADWQRLRTLLGDSALDDSRFDGLAGRVGAQSTIEDRLSRWTIRRDKRLCADELIAAGIPAAPVLEPAERIDGDESLTRWGLWPEVTHPLMGAVRVDGLPFHLSDADWSITRSAPTLGQHNDVVFGDLLGLSSQARDALSAAGAI